MRKLSVLFAALLTSACCTPPKDDSRIVQQCTNITNIVGKNYELSASLQSPKVKGGINFGSRYKLPPEAVERQIALNRLCRQFAVGQLSEAAWVEAHAKYVIASAQQIPLSDSDALDELKGNLAELQLLVAKLVEFRGDTGGSGPSVGELLDRIMNASKEDLKALMRELEKLDSLSNRFDSSNADISSLLEVQNQRQVLIENHLTEVKRMLSPPLATWKQLASFEVGFEKPVYFLTEGTKSTLKQQLDLVIRARDYRIELDGYADPSGSLMTNFGLSWQRAIAVESFIVDAMGGDPAKVHARGRGVRTGGTAAGNRVVAIRAFGLIPVDSIPEGGPSE